MKHQTHQTTPGKKRKRRQEADDTTAYVQTHVQPAFRQNNKKRENVNTPPAPRRTQRRDHPASSQWVLAIIGLAFLLGLASNLRTDNVSAAEASVAATNQVAATTVDAVPVAIPDDCHKLRPRGPWAVVSGAGAQEIELAFAGYGHWDLYPRPGTRTVSYISEPVGRIGVYMGHGSAWEQPADCPWETFDWLGDASRYQVNRGRQRGSGLVANIQQRTEGNFIVVHINSFNLSQEEVCTIIAEQNQAWRFDDGRPPVWQLHEIGLSDCGSQVATVVTTIAPPTQPVVTTSNMGPAQGCPPAKRIDYFDRTDVTLTGPAIMDAWWNNNSVPFGQTQVKVMVPPGVTVTFIQVLGVSYQYENTQPCIDNLRHEIDTEPFPEKTIAELRAIGVVR